MWKLNFYIINIQTFLCSSFCALLRNYFLRHQMINIWTLWILPVLLQFHCWPRTCVHLYIQTSGKFILFCFSIVPIRDSQFPKTIYKIIHFFHFTNMKFISCVQHHHHKLFLQRSECELFWTYYFVNPYIGTNSLLF